MVQARALLLAADGVATNEVARRCGTPAESVRAWRRRFVEQGALTVSGYRTGTGLGAGTVEALVDDTLRCMSNPMTARRNGRPG